MCIRLTLIRRIPLDFDSKTQLWQSKQGNRDVTSYYNEMVTLWQELDQCYDDTWENANDWARYMKKEENDQVYMILAGVNQALNKVKGWILGKETTGFYREAFSEISKKGVDGEL